MKQRSKMLAVLLLLAMALTCLAGCAPKEPPPAEGGETKITKVGLLALTNISPEEHCEKVASYLEKQGMESPQMEDVFFDTLGSMMLALQAGQIDKIGVPLVVAEYIVAGNNALFVEPASPIKVQEALSMAVLEDNTELLTLLNDAIAALQADGTIDALVAEHIEGASPNVEPTAVDLPMIEGAKTIKVAVTGDIPPIDYVSADGKPAGFNVALLSAVSEQAGINIELVKIDSAARVAALTGGRADAAFWVRSVLFPDGTADSGDDAPPGVSLTDPYFTTIGSFVAMK